MPESVAGVSISIQNVSLCSTLSSKHLFMYYCMSMVDLQSRKSRHEMVTQRGNEIYERHLCLKGRGFPLWIPEPNKRLPLAYQKRGIAIGDVGIITRSGAFSFLFNICVPSDDPINPPLLPEGFTPIHPPLDALDVAEFNEFKPGSYLASASIENLQSGFDARLVDLGQFICPDH